MVNMILIVLGMAHTGIAVEYQSKVLSQRISHFDNPQVDFGVKYYGDEGYPYLVVKEVISPYNDLHLLLYARVYDQPPHLLTSAPLSLCKLLHDDRLRRNGTLAQFNVPQIYNFDGKSCPIEQGRISLSPYMFPATFETEVNLGCGIMNVESRLLKCDDGESSYSGGRTCATLLKTLTVVFLQNESCKIDEKNVPNWTDLDSSV
ncbi:uncharacterized protein LOC106641106 [Copidosoma floridanum]|uniref:uncharacterized protein LOC106641106 n=1 Tax=Copidosoma floridanum TaxID=29053 RepID=UPI0006C9727B|nr:uncharacterized protein LOC106641106 [Copidosoma floridanum]